jgi:hypothetical protein
VTTVKFAWSVVSVLWDAFAPGRRKGREAYWEAWLVPRAQYQADCEAVKAMEREREEVRAA